MNAWRRLKMSDVILLQNHCLSTSQSTQHAVLKQSQHENRDNLWPVAQLGLPLLPLSPLLLSNNNKKNKSSRKTRQNPPWRKRTHACGNVLLLRLIRRCVEQRHSVIIIRTEPSTSIRQCVSYKLGPKEDRGWNWGVGSWEGATFPQGSHQELFQFPAN